MTTDDEMASQPSHPLHVLLAGGGTGGHVFPALAVAEELAGRGWRVSFAGAAAGLEARLVAARGLPFHPLPARPFVGRGPLARLGALGTLAASARAAAKLVRRLGVDAVLGTGGYVSAPAVLGARLARRPALLLEPNAHAGVANRWLSLLAQGAAVGYAETVRDLRCPAWVTGVPVRAAFFAVPALVGPHPPGPPLPPPLTPAPGEGGTSSGEAWGRPSPGEGGRGGGRGDGGEGRLRLLVLGGSQGAQQVNRVLPAAAARLLAALPALSILHQAGARNLEETRQAYAALDLGDLIGPRVEVVPFLDDVAGAMAASHLLISRAGAITLAEICAAGRPALLLPLAIAQGHQVDNARVLAAAGAAEVLAEPAPDSLAARLIALFGDPARLAAMGRAARGLAKPRAVADIADRLESVARAAHAGGGR